MRVMTVLCCDHAAAATVAGVYCTRPVRTDNACTCIVAPWQQLVAGPTVKGRADGRDGSIVLHQLPV